LETLFISSTDYTFVSQFVENAKANVANDCLLLFLGPGQNGKTTLIREICQYLTKEAEAEAEEAETEGRVVRLYYDDLCDECTCDHIIENIPFGATMLAETCDMGGIHDSILGFVKVVRMNHVFSESC